MGVGTGTGDPPPRVPGTPPDPPVPPPQPSAFEERAVAKVDDLLESYMGIRDSELGEQVLGTPPGPPLEPPSGMRGTPPPPRVLGTLLAHPPSGSPPSHCSLPHLGVLGSNSGPHPRLLGIRPPPPTLSYCRSPPRGAGDPPQPTPRVLGHPPCLLGCWGPLTCPTAGCPYGVLGAGGGPLPCSTVGAPPLRSAGDPPAPPWSAGDPPGPSRGARGPPWTLSWVQGTPPPHRRDTPPPPGVIQVPWAVPPPLSVPTVPHSRHHGGAGSGRPGPRRAGPGSRFPARGLRFPRRVRLRRLGGHR